MATQLVYGIGLLVLMGLMVWVARPRQGQDGVPWLRAYIVGQMYVMSAMICGIAGVALLIQNWPRP